MPSQKLLKLFRRIPIPIALPGMARSKCPHPRERLAEIPEGLCLSAVADREIPQPHIRIGERRHLPAAAREHCAQTLLPEMLCRLVPLAPEAERIKRRPLPRAQGELRLAACLLIAPGIRIERGEIIMQTCLLSALALHALKNPEIALALARQALRRVPPVAEGEHLLRHSRLPQPPARADQHLMHRIAVPDPRQPPEQPHGGVHGQRQRRSRKIHLAADKRKHLLPPRIRRAEDAPHPSSTAHEALIGIREENPIPRRMPQCLILRRREIIPPRERIHLVCEPPCKLCRTVLRPRIDDDELIRDIAEARQGTREILTAIPHDQAYRDLAHFTAP